MLHVARAKGNSLKKCINSLCNELNIRMKNKKVTSVNEHDLHQTQPHKSHHGIKVTKRLNPKHLFSLPNRHNPGEQESWCFK